MAPSEEKEIQDLIADESQLLGEEVWSIEQFLRYPEFVIDTNDEAPVEEQVPSENDELSQDPLENRKATSDGGDQDTDMTGISDDETLEFAEGPVKDQDFVAEVPSGNDENSQDPLENWKPTSDGGDQDTDAKGVSDDEILALGEGSVKEWNDKEFWAELSKWEYLDYVLEANHSRLSGDETAMETPIEAGAGEFEAEEPQSEVCFGDC